MDIKKILLGLVALPLMISAFPQKSEAQWSLGASYEVRNESPKNGFGIRVERKILQKLPIVDLSLRGHFSYFNDENELSWGDDSNSNKISTDIQSYDFGLAAVGGVSLGMVAPYIGLGLGSETVDLDPKEDADFGSESDSKLFWNGFIGAKVKPIPLITPFVEYRVKTNKAFSINDLNRDKFDNSSGRFIIGLSLAF